MLLSCLLPPTLLLLLPSPGPIAPEGVDIERAFPRLRFERPVFLTGADDGTDRIFVVDQGGVIHVFPNVDDPERSEVFLDLSDAVSRRGNEEGLLGLAFHPKYAENGTFFVHYSSSADKEGILSSFQVSDDDANRADPDSELELMSIEQPYRNHNGGMIAFGPDGLLYVSLGDGGAADDPHGHGQNLTTWLGAILRIDVDGETRTENYAIPPDNPFADGANGARPEIYALGFRNVWRFSFDRATGELFAADVGQNEIEEVHTVVRGGNYGWNRYEGDADFEEDTVLATEPALVPIVTYPHSEGISITGGYVYRGSAFPSLEGQYFYGDYSSGNLWRLVPDGRGGWSDELVRRTGRSIASFGEDDAGELFLTSFDGGIYRLVPSDEPEASFDDWPEKLSDTGLYASVRKEKLADHVVPYEVNAPFWSDGAEKGRYFVLPEGERFGYRETGAWDVPVGATLVKTFRARQMGRMRTIETRLIKRTDDGWEGASYVWDDRGREARLAPEGRQFELWRRDGVPIWHAPSATECATCHVESAGYVLGLETAQLNGGDQIEAFAKAGYLDLPTSFDAETAPRFVDPHEEGADLEIRARTWLDVNCAMCHFPNGPGNASIDLRASTALAATNMLGEEPAQGDLGIEDALLVAPGEPARSVLLERVHTLGPGRMPNVGSNQVDEAAVELLTEWIRSLD